MNDGHCHPASRKAAGSCSGEFTAVFQRRDIEMLFEKPGKIDIAGETGTFSNDINRIGPFNQHRSGQLQTALDQELLRRQSDERFEQTPEMPQCLSVFA